ncbi:MAG: hypothetical protein K6E15_05760 [Prevotella sp.]|nr:hypothetical protein [Prevotella sp.]
MYGTRTTTDAVDYSAIGALMVAFYDKDSTEVYSHTQLRIDPTTYTTFGDFTFTLPVGQYTMLVVGRDYRSGDVFQLNGLTSAGYTSERVRETMSTSQEVSVIGTDPVDVPVTIGHVITFLNVLSTDVRPSEVVKIRTTYSAASKSYDPTTGLATDSLGFSLTNSTGDAEYLKIGNYAFLSHEEMNMDITIESLDTDDKVLFSKKIPSVPLKLNRKTILRGPLFTPNAISIKVETEWEDPMIIDFD